MKELFERSQATHTRTADGPRTAGSTDLAALCGFVVVAVVVLVGWNPPAPPLRAVVGVPLLFLAPGYAVVSLCFPARSSGLDPGTAGGALGGRTPSDGERIALSFATSLAILPILGVVLPFVATFRLGPIVAAVAGVTVVGAVGAWIRRRRLSPARRYRPSRTLRWSTLRSALFPTGSPLLAATNVVLAVSVVLAVATGGYALLSPLDGERYTGMQLLAADDDGDLVAAGYPTEIEPGDSVSLTVAVDNQERREVTYDLVVRQERYVDGERRDDEVLHEATLSVEDAETVHRDVAVTPTAESGDLRLVYLLYVDGVPEDPSPENAYRYTHVWIDVGEASPGGDPGEDGPPTGGDDIGSDDESGDSPVADGNESDDGPIGAGNESDDPGGANDESDDSAGGAGTSDEPGAGGNESDDGSDVGVGDDFEVGASVRGANVG
ncbi:DUF1616 domain-containing protein [Halovivax cerinus]|uniref:DUF1616 domain-containing protein n=1 Tax=Halovivax cerinus TaxID=1487865 RepID=A0ABD5NTF5_9EURY|nr:DUF1616 domain-containing protein [Halovivax cerinus]